MAGIPNRGDTAPKGLKIGSCGVKRIYSFQAQSADTHIAHKRCIYGITFSGGIDIYISSLKGGFFFKS